jgi:hypothetical protein
MEREDITMADYVTRPIPLAEMTIAKSMLTYRLNFGQPYTQIAYNARFWSIYLFTSSLTVPSGST